MSRHATQVVTMKAGYVAIEDESQRFPVPTGHRRVRRPGIARASAAGLIALATPLLLSCGGPGDGTASTSTSGAATTPSTAPTTSTTSPSSRPTATPTYDSNTGTSPAVSLAFGARNGTAQVAYAVGDVFHDGDRTVRLPVSGGVQDLQYLARLEGGGVLVLAPAKSGAQPLIIVDSSGGVVGRFADVEQVVVSDSGSRIATSDAAGTLRLRDVTGRSLASFATKDPNVTLSGILGDSVYYYKTTSKGWATRVWQSATGKDTALVSGSVRDINETTGLAVVWPNQEFEPQHTCYSILDLRRVSTRYVSCGEFAPMQFTADGSMVVGVYDADGGGSSRWKIASTKDGAILLRVLATGGAWAPGPLGANADGLTVGLLNRERATQQAIASCTVAPRSCTVDTKPVSVGPTAWQTDNYPITLSAN